MRVTCFLTRRDRTRAASSSSFCCRTNYPQISAQARARSAQLFKSAAGCCSMAPGCSHTARRGRSNHTQLVQHAARGLAAFEHRGHDQIRAAHPIPAREPLDWWCGTGARPKRPTPRNPGLTSTTYAATATSTSRRCASGVRADWTRIACISRTRSSPKDRAVYLYCTCARQASSARELVTTLEGTVLRIAVIRGGLRAWPRAGLAVEAVPADDIAAMPGFK